jgi:hypothetical protein
MQESDMDLLAYLFALLIALFVGGGAYMVWRWGGPRDQAPDETRPPTNSGMRTLRRF